MFPENIDNILSRISDTDVVLDVGGWACPFNRANWVIDSEPYETRGYYTNYGGPAFQGPELEWFSEATWVQRDICDRSPWPFDDNQFDFVICSHTLEDVRDPIWVSSELIRVAKRGYIEVPSREWESCRGIERPNMVGMSHHRWLVEIDPVLNHVNFVPKFQVIHSHWSLSFPRSYLLAMPPAQSVSWHFWENEYTFGEPLIHGTQGQVEALQKFVRSKYSYPAWRFWLETIMRAPRKLVYSPQVKSILKKLRTLFR